MQCRDGRGMVRQAGFSRAQRVSMRVRQDARKTAGGPPAGENFPTTLPPGGATTLSDWQWGTPKGILKTA